MRLQFDIHDDISPNTALAAVQAAIDEIVLTDIKDIKSSHRTSVINDSETINVYITSPYRNKFEFLIYKDQIQGQNE